jgi:hypothetical protein
MNQSLENTAIAQPIQTPVNAMENDQSTSKKNDKVKKVLIVFSILLILSAAAVSTYYLLFYSTNTSKDNDTQNTSNEESEDEIVSGANEEVQQENNEDEVLLTEEENPDSTDTNNPTPADATADNVIIKTYSDCNLKLEYDKTEDYSYEEDIEYRKYLGESGLEVRIVKGTPNTGNVEKELLINCGQQHTQPGEDVESLLTALKERWSLNGLDYSINILDESFAIGNAVGYKADFTFNSEEVGSTTERIYLVVHENRSYILRTTSKDADPDKLLTETKITFGGE